MPGSGAVPATFAAKYAPRLTTRRAFPAHIFLILVVLFTLTLTSAVLIKEEALRSAPRTQSLHSLALELHHVGPSAREG